MNEWFSAVGLKLDDVDPYMLSHSHMNSETHSFPEICISYLKVSVNILFEGEVNISMV